jgi:intracellular sulfur oxidation DsrE/DsrF family protein
LLVNTIPGWRFNSANHFISHNTDMENAKHTTHRRGFLGTIAAGAAALGIAFLKPLHLNAEPLEVMTKESDNPENPDEWFDKIKGKHRIIYDVTHPQEAMPFAWPRVFLITNDKTGTPPKDCSVVVVLRHNAIPFAFEDRLWKKYKFGNKFKIDDPAIKTAAIRNPFWNPAKGDFTIPGMGEVQIGINELQADGVMFCVCDVAITVQSAVIAKDMKMDADEVKKDWLTGLLPGIMVVPSGVWAVGRAQEHSCSYCFVG